MTEKSSILIELLYQHIDNLIYYTVALYQVYWSAAYFSVAWWVTERIVCIPRMSIKLPDIQANQTPDPSGRTLHNQETTDDLYALSLSQSSF